MEVKYDTWKLSDVLKKIDNGEIRLPNFQRDFRWGKNDIVELIVSLLNGYPIGILLFWDVSQVKEGDRLDSRLFEGVDEKGELSDVKYLVLDGQQRLTSLYQLLYKEFVVTKGGKEVKFFLNLQKIKEGEIDDCVEVYDKKVLQKRKLNEIKEQVKEHLLPLDILLNPNKIREFEEWKGEYKRQQLDPEILQKGKPDEIIERLNELEAKFKEDFLDVGKPINKLVDYQLRIIELESIDLDAVAMIFEKLNSTGLPLNIFEILTAKFYDKFSLYGTRNLREAWEETKERYQLIESFTKDEKDNSLAILILKAILLKKSIEENKKALECKRKNLLKDLTAKDIEDYWDKCAESLNKSLNKLREEYGCPSPKYLPYSTILVPFSLAVDFIGSKVPLDRREDAYRKLERWYWASVFSERYDSATDTRSKKDINEIIEWIKYDDRVPEAVERFDINSINLEKTTRGAVFTGVLNIIIKRRAKDFVSGESINELVTRNPTEVDVHHIFPRKKIPEGKRELGDSILNKTILKSETNREFIKDNYPSEYIEKIRKKKGKTEEEIMERMKGHLIPADKLMANDFDGFIEERKRLIMEEIKKLVELA